MKHYNLDERGGGGYVFEAFNYQNKVTVHLIKKKKKEAHIFLTLLKVY